MKRTLTSTTLILALGAVSAGTAQAATISASVQFLAQDDGVVSISASMNNSNAFIKDATGATVADLTGTVVDYEFPEGEYKGDADVVAEIPTNAFGNRLNIDLWTEDLDPGSDPAISTAADSTSPGGGTVDISSLSGGTVWIITGTFNSDITLNATMSDTDGALGDVTMTQLEQLRPNDGTRGNYYLFAINFADAGDYEEISFTTSGDNYLGGVIVSAVPEPGSLALLSAGALCMLRRRR